MIYLDYEKTKPVNITRDKARFDGPGYHLTVNETYYVFGKIKVLAYDNVKVIANDNVKVIANDNVCISAQI